MTLQEKSVFINCPFDDEYKPLLKPLLFTLVYLGFEPCLSYPLSYTDGRMQRIEDKVRNSQYSIHDLSRCARPPKKLPRGYSFGYNNAFEFGFEMACKKLQPQMFESKKVLLLTDHKHNFKKYFSDAGDLDPERHRGKPEAIVKITLDWFARLYPKAKYGEAQDIWTAFSQFNIERKKSALKIRAFKQGEAISTYAQNAREYIQTLIDAG